MTTTAHTHNCLNTAFINAQLEALHNAITVTPEFNLDIKLSQFGTNSDFIYCEFLSPYFSEALPCERKSIMKIIRELINESCAAYNALLTTENLELLNEISQGQQINATTSKNRFNIGFVIYLLDVIRNAFMKEAKMAREVLLSKCGIYDDQIFFKYFQQHFSTLPTCLRESLIRLTRAIINITCEAYDEFIIEGYYCYESTGLNIDELKTLLRKKFKHSVI